MEKSAEEKLDQDALDYHLYPRPGKIKISATKQMVSQRDLALAYSPGVAAASRAIAENPDAAYDYTIRGNLVAVISNGTAVLGLGNIGALASKPVMEGKAVLFKKFAGVDAFDIEIDEADPDKFIEIVVALAPTFGGINLEDIRAPECFRIEKELRDRLDIPVMHDDQHGTAICVAAAVRNGLHIAGKELSRVKFVCSGAGSAALACLDLLLSLGLDRGNLKVFDSRGLICKARAGLNERKAMYASDEGDQTLAQALVGADIFLGLSGPGLVRAEDVAAMSKRPLVLALANPEPEIRPEAVLSVQPDAIVATGRSDYPNQVNNVLCFPFLFRGALDVGASGISDEMKMACVEAISNLARREPAEQVLRAYGGDELRFGPNYILPKPFDPRLAIEVPMSVAKAAMASGVARRPLKDPEDYHRRLERFAYRSGFAMRPIFQRAQTSPQRVVFADGESRRVLGSAQIIVDEGLAQPILLGRPEAIERVIRDLGLRLKLGDQVQVLDPGNNPKAQEHAEFCHKLLGRRGVSPAAARVLVRTDPTALAALLVQRGEADVVLCGIESSYREQMWKLVDIIGIEEGIDHCVAAMLLISSRGNICFADTHVRQDPTAEELVQTAEMAAGVIRRFSLDPRIALISRSSFGSDRDDPGAEKMRRACEMLRQRHPELEVEGEMQINEALSHEVRERRLPSSTFSGNANLLIMPSCDAANIAANTVTMFDQQAVVVGPLLLGLARPAHVLMESVTSRGVVNMTAFACVEAIEGKDGNQLGLV